MYILINNKRYASTDADMLLSRLRSMFPKYPMYIEIDTNKKVEIINTEQLVLAVRIVALEHTQETETEVMERKAHQHMLEPSSDEESDCAQDMDEAFYEQLGIVTDN